MAGKRQATTDLNHENWDREEDPEERGTFRAASAEEMKTRVLKKARRKIVDTNADAVSATSGLTPPPKSVFSGFSGFGNIKTLGSNTGSTPFSFLSKISDTNIPGQVKQFVANESVNNNVDNDNNTSKSAMPANAIETIDVTDEGPKSKEYYSSLINLNRAFCDWIKLCIDNDPLCFLTPVFKDYDNFLTHLNQKEKSSHAFNTPTFNVKIPKNIEPVATNIVKPTFSFSSSSAFAGNSSNETKPTNQKSSIFGDMSSSFTAPKPNGFSLNAAKTTPSTIIETKEAETVETKKPSGFSFTPGAQPFTFANIQAPPQIKEEATHNDDDDEENQPPKIEFKQVVEEDAIYSKKCKVFVKKDDTYSERGVGTLYLKPVKDSEKTQLLVRADTNLGNILVNLILSSGIPAKRLGKNNVLLVCIPTPEEKTTSPLLLRVKNEAEANDLLTTIKKYQK